ncbi:nicotinic acid mononucleotide adenylyltransferase [Sulfurifustis variabilis]|uniref:Probable nicotinate-nucleotide adenylyltransferase n=1 Tax=Sulfurifustis variabilis TaxID=1675686 RepID=A0A1B4V3U3_9GAMM|nr:nicotinate-nucleotide adenylyltransferase [Sulfurifustis variabilis]BAU47182.1 nicotinic acid mononucleotide adenylyltransferase [Sulfurifustis variabilis]
MIGILGGTFDPIHYGHLRPAQDAARQLGLTELRLVPAATPPHRRRPVAHAAQRLRMVELAVAEFPGLAVDDREIRRGGLSYTVPTLESVRAEIGTTPLCLLLGTDAFRDIESWHRWSRLPELAHLVVLGRPGFPAPDAADLPVWARKRLVAGPGELRTRSAGGLLFLEVEPHDVSATRIRAAIARGETPPAEWLPASVLDYIRRNGIYRSEAA